MSIYKDLPKEELPRERLLLYGSNNLSNEELLSIIIRTGTKNLSVKQLANNILKSINSISDLKDMSISSLTKIKGLGEVKSITLLAALELGKRVYDNNKITPKLKILNALDAYRYFNKYIVYSKQENLLVIYLDNQKQYITHKIVFKGTINQSIIHPREIFKEAYLTSSSSIIIMHNHPSGDLTPSNSDDNTTRSIASVGEIMGIRLLDHLIVEDLANLLNHFSTILLLLIPFYYP
jgi:DNA repair protein RadC